jgi:hypothetical protein
MKIPLTATIAIFLCTTICKAQNPITYKSNAISIELGKTGLIYGLSYDHKFKAKNFGVRASAGIFTSEYLDASSFGAGGYYLFGKTNRFFELGMELQYINVDETSDDQKSVPLVYPDYTVKTFYPSLNLGYRRYGEKTLFRIGLSPNLIKSEFVLGGYVSFGLTF